MLHRIKHVFLLALGNFLPLFYALRLIDLVLELSLEFFGHNELPCVGPCLHMLLVKIAGRNVLRREQLRGGLVATNGHGGAHSWNN